ncbi:hypothetical protein CMI41_02425 [Candidatus Pacearchaeota archaeon]|nr:hypothetical protein [Candidatus Pacearchaeota archaeon]|tara:strand:+ start:86 stop:1186 length:1101 start_codon:yes stop_codon:yes gene_type:complete
MTQYNTQAQIELFADSGHVERFSKEQDLLLQNARRMSQLSTFPSLPNGFSNDLVGLVEKYQGSYRAFEGNAEPEQVRERADNARFYEQKFEPEVRKLKSQLEDADPKSIPGYLGRGSNGYAFGIEVDGQTYVVKFGRVGQMNFELKPLRKGRGVSNLSQLVAYSFEDAATVMELLPGRNVTEYDSITRPQYTDAELEGLVGTIDRMHKHGLVSDPKASNFMYDSEAGFSVLDYHVNEHGHSVADSVIELVHALTYTTDGQSSWKLRDSDRAEYDRLNYDSAFQRIDMTSRLLHIMKGKFPEIFAEALRRNEEMKADTRSSSFEKGYFNKVRLLESAEEYAKPFSDAPQSAEAIKSRVADIESLGFF